MQRILLILLALAALPNLIIANGSLNHPQIKWRFETGAPIRGTVSVSNGKLYFGNSAGTLYCLDKLSAKEIWRFQTAGAIVSQPLLVGGKAIFQARDNKVYAVDALSGKLLWSFQMETPVPHTWGWDYYDASPVAHGSNVLIGSGDNNLYALNLRSGKLAWKFSMADKIRATPLVSGSKVYVPDFNGFLYVVNATIGEEEGKYETEGVSYYNKVYGWDRTSLISRPAMKDNQVVFGARDGGLYSIDAVSLEKKWRFTYGSSWVGSSPTIDGNTVYVGWSDALAVSAVDMTSGKELWKYDGGSYFYSTPVVDEKHVYIGSFAGLVYAFEKTTGRVVWKYQTQGAVMSSPILDDGTLYVGSDDGSLYAFEEGEERVLAVYYPELKAQKEMVSSEKILPYLEPLGYARLDTTTLTMFMKDRIADKKQSSIVFAHQYIPRAVVGKEAEGSLLNQYMAAGGRVVWLGYFPNYWVTNKDFNIVASNTQYSTDLLNINFDVNMDFGVYYAKATEEGLKWGVPKSFESLGSSISGDQGIIPLAVNEHGRVAAFWKPLGSMNGGYISFCSWHYMPIRQSDLETIRKLAEHGL
ncbi:MAG: PQQ-binding-like beta-propeller repeat protein [Imperialibacter sp.]|uniref:outer membrane protein assembly factor BamB family protein n=1 Tax=Imperialibacter sp. TaxID=2038411 RepID=UPI0032EFE645